MALDLVSLPFASELGPPPSKRRRVVWDVPDPTLLAEAARLQSQLACQLIQIYPSLASSQSNKLSVSSKVHEDSIHSGTKMASKVETKEFQKEGGKRAACLSPPWREDDEDGHFTFEVGDSLTSRYKILQKMGEGTFGRVLECWDQVAQGVVAIKVVRSADRHREAAMIEIDVLQTLADKDRFGSRRKAHKYFRHERKLDWPDRYATRESIRAVDRLPKLRDLLMKRVDERSSSLLDMLERMFCYDPSKRLTAREALQHPFFQES